MLGNYWEMVVFSSWDSDEVQECKVFLSGFGLVVVEGHRTLIMLEKEKISKPKHNPILAGENKRLLSECGMEVKRRCGIES